MLRGCNMQPAVRLISAAPIRNLRTESYAIESDFQSLDVKSKPIPGPKPFPIIGNTIRFLPYVGRYGDKPLLDTLRLLRQDYGNIVKLDNVINRRPTIFLFSPDYCEMMYRQQGNWPIRIAMDTLSYYRKNRVSFFEGHEGLSTSQGKDWHDFRSKVNQHMMQPRAVKPHLSQINAATDELVAKMKTLRNSETKELPGDFNNELNKWALESICSIALDHRIGCLRHDLSKDSEPQTMINCVHEMFQLMYKLEIQPSLWKVYNTSNLKRFFRALDTLNSIAVKYVTQAKERLQKSNLNMDSKHNKSILEKLLMVDERVARVMSIDMLTAGVDTTGNASAALLYYIATNPEKQEKLKKEVDKLLPEKNMPITFEILNEASYVKACIKEALRLFPISIGTLRTMPQDVEIGGYLIKKGEDTIACHATICKDESQFPQPEEFIPERWLRNETGFPSAKTAHPFTYMPFGFGARTCIGRRFAEVEIETLIMKVMRNFRLEWHKSPLEAKSHLINVVSTPLEIKLLDA